MSALDSLSIGWLNIGIRNMNKTPEKKLRQVRERAQRLIAAGLCVVCAKKSRPKKTMCAKCAKSHVIRCQKVYLRTLERGVCTKCRGRNEDSGEFVLCRACRVTSKCKGCGCNKPGDRNSYCPACKKKQLRKHSQRYYDKRVSQGICTGCGGVPRDGSLRCEKCLAKQRAAMNRLNAKRRAERSTT